MRLQLQRPGWWPAAAAATVIFGVLCAALPAAAASGGGARAAARPAVPVLHWQPCTGAGQTGFDCATAQVPLDYQQPHGPMIQLAVIKHPATDPAKRIGSLFFNPGGPGTAGTSDLPVEYSLFPAAVRQRFDIVSWDPRGVGNSTAATCFPTPADEAKFFADLPAGFPVGHTQQATWFSRYERFGQRCEQTNPALLRHVSTAETARDLNLLRQAVGDPVLNYYGVSYGTYLGATYANLFPGKVGAMVLGANVNPVAWARPEQADGIALSTSIRLKSDVGAAATLGQFLSLCGHAATSGCAFSAGSASATRAKYVRLLNDLRAHPVSTSIPAFGNTPATPVITFTYAFTAQVVDEDLFVTHPVPGLAPGWAYGAFLLQTLWRAAHSAHSASRAHGTAAAAAAPPSGPPPQWAVSILCADSPNPRNPADYQAEAAFAHARSGALGSFLAWEDSPCAGWRATDADGYFGPWNHPTAHTLLLVATTFDPATPYQDSLVMAHQLARARLLTVDGYGHTSLDNPSSCVYRYEASYFINGTLPPAGTVCHQNQPPFTTTP